MTADDPRDFLDELETPTYERIEQDGWWARRARRRRCFHHNWRTGRTFISSQLIDTGMRKMFWCDEIKGGCGKMWIP